MAAPFNPFAPQTQAPAAPAPAPGTGQQGGGQQPQQPAATPAAAVPSSAEPSSSGPPDTYIPATQTVPVADPNAIANAQASAEEGRKQFPTAAAAAVGIVAGIIALFVAYKAYRWWTKRRAARISAAALPIMNEMGSGSTRKSTYLSPYDSAGGYIYPDSTSSFKAARHTSTASFAYDEPPSPNTPSAMSARPLLDSRESTDALKKIGSRQSLQAFGAPSAASNRASHMSAGSSVGHRSSYAAAPRPARYSGAPHSMHSRIDISVPQPLGAPPGNVVATDPTTLQFASDMGSGSLGAVEPVAAPRVPTPPSASASAHQPYAVAPQSHNRSRVTSSGGQSASSAGASVSAAQRAAYLAHGHRASSAAFREPSSNEGSSLEDASSSDDGGILGKMRGAMRAQQVQPAATHGSSSGSIGGIAEVEQYQPPSSQLDNNLGANGQQR